MNKPVSAIHISLAFVLLLIICGEALATSISLETTVTASAEGDRASISVLVKNKGDEPAHNLRVSADLGGSVVQGQMKNSVGPAQEAKDDLSATVSFQKPGRYPIVVRIEYTDANLYPFSALAVSYLNYGEPATAHVVGSVLRTEIEERGSVPVTVKNLDNVSRTIAVTLLAPAELSVANPRLSVETPAGEEKTVTFDVLNRSARPGSSYALFAVMSYEDQLFFHTGIGTGVLQVKERRSPVESYKWLLLSVVIVLGLVIVFYNLRRSGKDRQAAG